MNKPVFMCTTHNTLPSFIDGSPPYPLTLFITSRTCMPEIRLYACHTLSQQFMNTSNYKPKE